MYKFRLYYWIYGAPENRPGGPWWYRDFKTAAARDNFLAGIRSQLCKYAKTEGDDLSFHGCMEIYPPESEVREVK